MNKDNIESLSIENYLFGKSSSGKSSPSAQVGTDNRIEPDHQGYKTHKQKLKDRATKKENSHEKGTQKPPFNNLCMQRGLRAAALHSWEQFRRPVVYVDNTLPHIHNQTTQNHLAELIDSFPETVSSGLENEAGNTIYLPFKLLAWKDLNEASKTYFYQLTLSELEATTNSEYKLIPFVFNESRSLTKTIESQKLTRLGFLRDRIQKGLNEALARPEENKIMFWFSFETARRGQPHIQGSLLIRPDEAKKARDFFHKLNGKATPREKRGAIMFRSNKRRELINKRGYLYTTLNWADYNIKERSTTRRIYTGYGSTIAATQPLIQASRGYYERLRNEWKQSKKSADKTFPIEEKIWGSY